MGKPKDQIEHESAVPSAPVVEAKPEEPARLGPAARLTGTLFSPGETFADVNRKPTWLAPMLIAIVTALASTMFFNWYVNPNWDRIAREQIKKQEQATGQSVPPEAVEQQAAGFKIIGKLFPLFAVIGTPIFYLLLSGIFALGLMLVQAQTTFKKILSVVSWSACATSLIGTIVLIASLLVRSRESLDAINPMDPGTITATNLSVLLSANAAAPIRAIAASLDVFTIWFLILLTIGFAAIAGARKFTTRKTAVLVFGLWAVWIIIRVGWAAVFGG